VARYLEVRDCFNETSEKGISVTHLVGLSGLKSSISIDDGVGARDK
jgi:hypothetical protein